MAQPTDLYPILRAYANKNNSPYINIEEFIAFLETYSNRKAPEQPEWIRWTGETGVKFWSELASLVESERCVLMADTSEGRIYMPYYYLELLKEAYRSIDDTADLPFPSEESLRITIPEQQVKILKLETDLAPFFEPPGSPASLPDQGPSENKGASENSASPPSIIKLIFPDGFSSALLLSPMIPRRLMEAALLKVRHYLRTHNNREFTFHKLSPQLPGKEKYLRETLDQILFRPIDCLSAMESFSDFAWLFWAYFCALVKNDIKKKKETLAEDLAAIQAVFVIEICNGFYKARAIKQRERETAFRSLELRMEKPPYYYTLEEIQKFTNDKGVSLIGLYTQEELEAYIKKRMTENTEDGLPEWLLIQRKKSGHGYIKKDKLLPLCTKLLAETRPLVEKEITERWVKLIRSFKSEAAMEKDVNFDRLLASYTAVLNPLLMVLLEDEKLLFVYEELEHTQKVIPVSFRIFKGGKLIPMNVLYALRRKILLADAKIKLPFWYSIPILAALIAFFKNLGKKQTDETLILEDEIEAGEKTAGDIQNIARSMADQLVPLGQTLDEYLTDLESRWSRLLNKQARQNLIEDVNALIRDKLRQTIRVHKKKPISRENL
ncbi:MAG: hypothetical protein LBL28_06210, partial [Treponema sp.]|nr:hypothetical protein [Treponema sp.]